MDGRPQHQAPEVPISGIAGMVWPACPRPQDARLLAIVQQLEHSQWWPPQVLRGLQLRQIELLLSHAVATVPYYRQRMTALAGLRRGGLTMEAFRELPILRRADIQEAGAALHSERAPEGHGPISEIRSSGSTGRPVTVKTSAITQAFFLAANLRYHRWHGRHFAGKTAAIRILPKSQANPEAERRANWVPAYRSGPIVRFDVTRPLTEQMAWLEAQNAEYLLTNPSNLGALIRRFEDAPKRIPRMRRVATMGEVLDPAVRTLCETVWKLPLSDVYSSQEVGFVALQCPDHPHYHEQAESVLVEILDERGRPCRPGEVGRVVVTDLHNLVMPLIRYEIGDYAEKGDACSCGRGLPVLNRILGRTRNMLVLPSGDQAWPRLSSKAIAALPAIRQVQLVQRSLTRIDARLVVAAPLSADEEAGLKTTIAENIGHPFEIRLDYVAEIPRAASGKFEDFISEVAVPPLAP